jgi:hypothetical protein
MGILLLSDTQIFEYEAAYCCEFALPFCALKNITSIKLACMRNSKSDYKRMIKGSPKDVFEAGMGIKSPIP